MMKAGPTGQSTRSPSGMRLRDPCLSEEVQGRDRDAEVRDRVGRQRLKKLRSEVKNAEKKALEMEPSSDNVFADLGLADAGEHLIKAGLVVKIDQIIRQRHLTQSTAAQLMGIDQPKVSAMLAGQFRGYSVERLMRFLVALGHDVEIVVKPGKRGSAALRVA